MWIPPAAPRVWSCDEILRFSNTEWLSVGFGARHSVRRERSVEGLRSGRLAAPRSPAQPPVAVTPRTAPRRWVPGCARGERRRLPHVLLKPDSLGDRRHLTGGLRPAWRGARHAQGLGGRPVCLVRVGAKPPRRWSCRSRSWSLQPEFNSMRGPERESGPCLPRPASPPPWPASLAEAQSAGRRWSAPPGLPAPSPAASRQHLAPASGVGAGPAGTASGRRGAGPPRSQVRETERVAAASRFPA